MKIKKIEQKVINWMRKWSIVAIRISFGIIFIWFGALKPLGLSSAELLLKHTVAFIPIGSAHFWLVIIGVWEVVIGITFLFKRTTKIAIILLFLHMFGTFMPLVLLPDLVYQNGNVLLPTLEGQYIIKNVMIISAALVLGGKLNKSSKS